MKIIYKKNRTMKLDLANTGKKYLSPSQLKAAYKGVDEYDHYLNGKREESSSLSLGTLVHCLVLEPETFDDRYIVFDGRDKIKEILAKSREDLEKKGKLTPAEIEAKISSSKPTATKEYKTFKAEFMSNTQGREVIDLNVYNTANTIKSKMVLSGIQDTYFSGGEAEKKTYGEIELSNGKVFDAMCIIDYARGDFNVDLKTTSEKDLSALKWSAIRYGYDIQAKTTEMLTGKPFVFVYVQTVEPYKIAVHTPSGVFMQSAEGKIEKAIETVESYIQGETMNILELDF
jgi:hypothetical protein